jgi:Fe-S-cluster containining protein
LDDRRAPSVADYAYRATVSAVAEALDGERTQRQAVVAAEGAARLLDGLLVGLDRENPPACRAGCAWCCHVSVACSPPEAIRVAAYVQSGLNKRDRRALSVRLDAFLDRTRDLDADARARLRIPCPFLSGGVSGGRSDGVCLVHPARPLACRGWHSFDVEQCKRHFRDPASQVDASGTRLALRGVVSRAVRDAVERGGLSGVAVDLAAAVRLVLSDGKSERDVVAAWLRGEDAFADARWRV